MSDTYAGIDWIFSCIRLIFTFMMSSWILAIIVLGSLLALVIQLYLNSRQK